MTLDRAELTGASAALVFHVALIAAMSMSLASVASAPEPPAMEVELVEEVGLQSAAPQPISPPPPSQAPEIGEAEPTNVAPVIRPSPAPSLRPAPARPQPQPSAPAREAPRVSRIGDDFLKGIADAPASEAPSKPAAARFDARAKASVAALFQRLVQPCANKQINPGEGANRIRVTVNLRLRRNGSLASASVVRVSGVDDENERYEQRVKDLATAVYRECSPFSGLPPELYRTPEGGWSNINLTYKLP
jgi:hypothetical protein